MEVMDDDGRDTSCGRREPAKGSAPSDDEERVDDTEVSRREADEQRDAAREDRWAMCLVNMVDILWPKRNDMKKQNAVAAKILTPFLRWKLQASARV